MRLRLIEGTDIAHSAVTVRRRSDLLPDLLFGWHETDFGAILTLGRNLVHLLKFQHWIVVLDHLKRLYNFRNGVSNFSQRKLLARAVARSTTKGHVAPRYRA